MKDLITDIYTTRWYRLGLELGINEKEMNIIREDCKGDAEEALIRTFILWLKTEQPTWWKMIAALRRIEENNLAYLLEQKYC